MSELLVLGFHRSGTSLATQLLHRAGLFVGDELIGAMETNPYGHFEDREVVRLHDEILRDTGGSWHVTGPFLPRISRRRWDQMAALVERRTSEHVLWGFKDPRTCLFAPAWRYLLPAAKAVVVFRDCEATGRSLKRRHARDLIEERGPVHLHRRFWQQPDHAERMWLAYNRALLSYVRAHEEDVLVIGFDDLARGFPLVHAIEQRWRLGLNDVATEAVFDPGVASEPVQHRPQQGELGDKIERVWRQLERRARDTRTRWETAAHGG